jgi:hypothetical protein
MPPGRALRQKPAAALAMMAALILTLAGGACQPRPATAPEPGAPPSAQPWPPYDYTAAADGTSVYRLDPDGTQIDVLVRPDGPLARFGHDHVIAVRDAEGFLLLAETEGGSRADLRFAVGRLGVDEPQARRRHGLDAGPDAADVAGTRDNLFQHVLDAEACPWVTVSLSAFGRVDEHWSADVAIDINGRLYRARQPFRLRFDAGVPVVEGFLVLRQTELGLQPFAALGGGMRVADPLEIHFRLQGTPR